jgi:3',5'-cyclic AMP phosphodiesterase CpdA
MTSGGSGVILGHITDAHVAPLGRPTTVLKHHSVRIIEDLIDQLRLRGADLTLFGGDNIDNRGHGAEDLEAFARAAERLDRFVAILGNHEAASPSRGRITAEDFARRLDGRGIRRGAYNFVESVGDVRVIGIDTTLQGSPGGYVSKPTMSFLARALNEGDEPHVVVLGHHLLYRSWEPYSLSAWDQEYLVANREHVTALLASAPRVRAYLCGHHHASRIQRVLTRGHHGGFYQILTASPVAFPHHARLLRFGPDGIHVETLVPRIDGLLEEGRDAVLYGRKARRYATLGASRTFLEYVQGAPRDNEVVLPYDAAPVLERRGVTPLPHLAPPINLR